MVLAGSSFVVVVVEKVLAGWDGLDFLARGAVGSGCVGTTSSTTSCASRSRFVLS